MLLLQTRFIIVLIALKVHEIQLVDEPALLQQLERAVYRNAVQLGIFFLGELVEVFRIQVTAGAIEEIQQNSPLARHPHAAFLQ